MDFRIFVLAALALCGPAQAQDSRTVTEPVMPPSCALLAPGAAGADHTAQVNTESARISGIGGGQAAQINPPCVAGIDCSKRFLPFPAAAPAHKLTITQQ